MIDLVKKSFAHNTRHSIVTQYFEKRNKHNKINKNNIHFKSQIEVNS